MDEYKDIYRQMTGIDIDEQRKIWDERGKGYYGEYLVLCELYRQISGNCKLLMNLHLPTESGETTEIDLLMIHETGFYVFEIKHYKGTIYGEDDDAVWTQYFRETPNHAFQNPIAQNGYHMRALRRLFPDVPIHSFVVFTSEQCHLKVVNRNAHIVVCALNQMMTRFEEIQKNEYLRYSMQDLDEMFCRLSPYSPMKQADLTTGKELPLHVWFQPIVDDLKKAKAQAVHEWNVKKNQMDEELNIRRVQLSESEKRVGHREKILKRQKWSYAAISSLFAVLCLIGCLGMFFVMASANESKYMEKIQENEKICSEKIQEAEDKLAKMEQKFSKVDKQNNVYIRALHSFVNISKCEILPVVDEAISLQIMLSLKTDAYAIDFSMNSKYIVKTRSGEVYEYAFFETDHDSHYGYLKPQTKNEREYKKIYLYGISKMEDIEYIKITEISLAENDDMSIYGDIKKAIKTGLELEIYSAP